MSVIWQLKFIHMWTGNFRLTQWWLLCREIVVCYEVEPMKYAHIKTKVFTEILSFMMKLSNDVYLNNLPHAWRFTWRMYINVYKLWVISNPIGNIGWFRPAWILQLPQTPMIDFISWIDYGMIVPAQVNPIISLYELILIRLQPARLPCGSVCLTSY